MGAADASAMTQALDAPSPLVTIRYASFYTPCSPDKATTGDRVLDNLSGPAPDGFAP
jgi:hypothetical protein